MKIIYKEGDLLEAEENIIIHGCNAQGVMGSGVALVIKNKYPEAYKTYRSYAGVGYRLGTISFAQIGDGKIIGNAITQEYYGRDKSKVYVDYDAVRAVFNYLNTLFPQDKIALPKIGAGLANGDWNVIEKIIEEECKDVQPVVYVLKEK